jgi:hypothetical protein
MTTKASPYRVLKAQADKIASALKAPGARARSKHPLKETVKVGIVMDDKVITLEMSWGLIAETTEPALAEYIVDQMRETSAAVH